MNKIGLIAMSFPEKLKDVCEQIRKCSDDELRIGYCRSEIAVLSKEIHPDIVWAHSIGAEHPTRLQELLRNCDYLLVDAGKGCVELCTLPLMSARCTFILFDETPQPETVSKLKSLSQKYGTRMGFAVSSKDIADTVIKFYEG